MANFAGRPVWAEVDLGAVAHNLAEIRRQVGEKTAVMAVVKANAYGHGLREVARALSRAGAAWLGVAVPEEALELRELGLEQAILVLSHTPAKTMVEAIKQDIRLTVYSAHQQKDLVDAARRAGKRAKIHLKVDTGMGRLGFPPSPAGLEEMRAIAAAPEVEAEGIFTHFASADEEDASFTRYQLGLFREVLARLAAAGCRFRWRHAANSAALLRLPETHFNLVRPGLALYGLYPSPAVNNGCVHLRPAMSLKSRIVFLKEVPAGTGISYGRTFVTRRESRIATLPLGYADGYSRLLSNCGQVLVRGKRAPVVGRVCMDQTMIDVTDVEGAAEGDEVVLFGRQGEAFLPVEELAAKMGTISYEVLCLVGERVPRFYHG